MKMPENSRAGAAEMDCYSAVKRISIGGSQQPGKRLRRKVRGKSFALGLGVTIAWREIDRRERNRISHFVTTGNGFSV
ncbi:MAG: hypothetical protein U0Y68_22930 [Blastocatellia bacterium]